MSESTPESEETRPTDAEVEAAAKALFDSRFKTLFWRKVPDDMAEVVRDAARAALEAAAALRQPREGAEAERKEQLWRAEWQQITDTAATLKSKLSTTEAALAESRGENETLKKQIEAALGLHWKCPPHDLGNENTFDICGHDDNTWPCPTVEALTPLEAPHEST